MAVTIPSLQKQYRLTRRGPQGFALALTEAPVRMPEPHEVLLRVRATSLNRRDLAILGGHYPVGSRETLVPLSDGAGEVVAVGGSVTRVHVGERVAAIFFQGWLEGRAQASTASSALGGALDGMLSQYVTLSEQGLVRIPSGLSFEEGATLPCAAVTAWNGLVTSGRLQSGDYVLLPGTGGVSVLGLQIAVAAGARPIVTSSSDTKLARAAALGAAATVNYRTHPDWEKEVLAATGGRGVDQILELGGSGTLARSLACLAPGGHVALIGGLSGFGGVIPAAALIGRSASVSGIFVGSRANFEALNSFIEQHRIRPVIDRVFGFDDAQHAFDCMASNSHFGKLVIRV